MTVQEVIPELPLPDPDDEDSMQAWISGTWLKKQAADRDAITTETITTRELIAVRHEYEELARLPM